MNCTDGMVSRLKPIERVVQFSSYSSMLILCSFIFHFQTNSFLQTNSTARGAFFPSGTSDNSNPTSAHRVVRTEGRKEDDVIKSGLKFSSKSIIMEIKAADSK